MIIPRRKFLNLLGVAAGTTGLGGCTSQWLIPDQRVEKALRGPGLESEQQSLCGLCEGSCGLSVRIVDGLPVGLKGNPNHPLNRGGLCPVGQSGLEVLYSPDRLQRPQRRGAGREYEAAEWIEVLNQIASRLRELRANGRGDRIAMLTGPTDSLLLNLSRQVMLVAESPNVARTDQMTTLPFLLAQGLDQVPAYDLAGSDLVLTFGLDLYEDGSAPIHAISAMIGARPSDERAANIHVGSRLSASAGRANEFISVNPGTYGAFALGVAHVLIREDRYDESFVAEHTFGFEDWETGSSEQMGFRRLLLEHYYPDRVALICGCPAGSIVRVARRLADASAPVALAGGDATRGSNPTWAVLAVHSINALIGAFDRPGGVILPPTFPFSPVPAPANTPPDDAGHLFKVDSEDPLLGIDPVEALARGVLEESHQIEVLFVMDSDPVHESPAGSMLAQAMEKIPLVVALTSFPNRTSQAAHIILPLHAFLEAWQSATPPPTVALGVLGISEPIVEPLFDTRHPGDILLELRRLAFPDDDQAMPWATFEDYLKARIQGVATSGRGAMVTGSFEESWKHFLEDRGWRFQEDMSPETFWNDLVKHAGWWTPVQLEQDWAKIFPTPSRRYEFFSQTLHKRLVDLGRLSDADLPEEAALQEAIERLSLQATVEEVCLPHFEPPHVTGVGELTLVPFHPLTARGRSGVHSPMVLEMFGHPVLTGWQSWAEICPETAHQLGLRDGDHVSIESERGGIELVVRILPGSLRGTVHVPLGLGHTVTYREPEVIGANPVGILHLVPDPMSGSLSLSSTRVKAHLVRRRPHGEPLPTHKGGHA